MDTSLDGDTEYRMADTIKRVLRKKKLLLQTHLCLSNARLKEMEESGILDETMLDEIKVNIFPH